MARLKVPSLQHAARIWRPDPERICKDLVKLVFNSPSFSYEKLYKLVRDMLVFGQSYDQLAECLRRSEKREKVLANFLELLALIHSHFEDIRPTFTHEVTGRLYPIARGLMVPFNPPLVYGVGGEIVFPWFIFWRSNPLVGERLSLFVTLVHEVLLQDPDLETAKFEILDCSSVTKGEPRKLRVIDSRDVPLLPETRKIEMLNDLAIGYFKAKVAVAALAKQSKDDHEAPQDPAQLGFFDA